MKTRTLGIVIVVVVVAVAAALALTARDSSSPGGDAAASGGSYTGEVIAPDAFEVADYAGKPLAVNLFGSWCPPCNAEATDLGAFAEQNPGAQVVGIACEDTRDAAKGFMAQYGLTYPLVVDDGSSAAGVAITAFPTTIFFDAQGKEVDRLVGASTWTSSTLRSRRRSDAPVTPADVPAPAPPMTAVEITSLSLTAIGLAFAAGLLSFVSPCVLPLLPVYLSFISGVGVEDFGREHRRLLGTSLLFVAGFTVDLHADGSRRRRHRPAADRVPRRADDRGRRLHRVQRPPGRRRDQAAGARAQGRPEAGRRRRRLRHRRRARHRLDAVRGLRPRRHPLHGGHQPERSVRGRCSSSSTPSGSACRSCSPRWRSTGSAPGSGWVKRHYRGIQVTAGALLVVFGVLMMFGVLQLLSRWMPVVSPGGL